MITLEQIVEIYAEEYSKLRALAYCILNNSQDADDVMQAVMLRLVEKPDMVSTVTTPKPFIRRCIRNEAIDRLRKKKTAAVPMDVNAHENQAVYIDGGYGRTESILYVKTYIRRLPPDIQEAFISHVIDGYRITDLAKELGMQPAALEKRFRRIKTDIRNRPGSLFTMIIFVICRN